MTEVNHYISPISTKTLTLCKAC